MDGDVEETEEKKWLCEKSGVKRRCLKRDSCVPRFFSFGEERDREREVPPRVFLFLGRENGLLAAVPHPPFCKEWILHFLEERRTEKNERTLRERERG